MERRWTSSTLAGQPSNPRPSETRSTGSGRQIKTLAELQRLSRQGDADAQWQLGLRYHDGEQVAQDDAQAMQWFLRAAEQGHEGVMVKLKTSPYVPGRPKGLWYKWKHGWRLLLGGARRAAGFIQGLFLVVHCSRSGR